MTALTIGTDTGGSIVNPSAVNAGVGLRPTLGVVDSEGVMVMDQNWDTAGPMTRYVYDTAAMMDVIGDPEVDYTGALSDSALDGARIGVHQPGEGDLTDARMEVWDAALADLEEQGATLVDVPLEVSYISGEGYTVKRLLTQYLQERTAEDFPVKDFHEFYEVYKDDAYDADRYNIGLDYLASVDALELDSAGEDEDTAVAVAARQTAIANFDAVFSGSDLDAVLSYPGSGITLMAPAAGYPS